jgi:serine/threonine-protein kinase
MTEDAIRLAPLAATTQARGTPALDATQAAPPGGVAVFTPPVSAARTTVLPHVHDPGNGVRLSLASRSRYEPTKLLGVGGMGEVVLVNDYDIDRKVAVKRLLPELTDPAVLARFVDEIRTVGRLEHPNIVPIHDVGVDELGRYFFVMKYVQGETLEAIIRKLADGDPAYIAKYSVEVRVEMFLGLLHALEYAHAQGVVHRDIKPANVMVGPFGEVVLMDWGIAKPLAESRDPASAAEGRFAAEEDHREGGRSPSVRATDRLYATRVGSLIGTPAYMSPEQARGDHARIDARSDLYAAIVVLHELLGLDHYLAGKETLEALLDAIQSEEFGFFKLLALPRRPPAELIHLLVKGLQKDPALRFQSAGELIAALHAILEGKVRVQCHITFTKRTFRELGRVVDRAPWLAFFMLLGLVAAVLFAVFQVVRALV